MRLIIGASFLFILLSGHFGHADPLIQDYNIDFGVVPILQRKTFQLSFSSDRNASSQNVGQVRISGDSDFSIENDGCSGASIPNGGTCYFDVVFAPTSQGQKTATFSYNWVSVYHDPGTGNYYPAGGTVNYHMFGNSCDTSLSLALEKSEVGPDKTSVDNQTQIYAHVTDSRGSPDCVSGKTIAFSSQQVEYSGGHNHPGPRPAGTFSPNTCTTDASGTCSVEFDAGEVAGTETITGILADAIPKQASVDIVIRVPGLVDFALSTGILNGQLFTLIGERSAHPDNHYLRPNDLGNIIGIANDIYDTYKAKAQLNDMSLVGGGLFDIGLPEGPFWAPPHHLHREGRSVDINHCAISVQRTGPNSRRSCPLGYVQILRRDILRFCALRHGHLVNEPNYHCEFYQ